MKTQWIQNPLKIQKREYLNGILYNHRKKERFNDKLQGVGKQRECGIWVTRTQWASCINSSVTLHMFTYTLWISSLKNKNFHRTVGRLEGRARPSAWPIVGNPVLEAVGHLRGGRLRLGASVPSQIYRMRGFVFGGVLRLKWNSSFQSGEELPRSGIPFTFCFSQSSFWEYSAY